MWPFEMDGYILFSSLFSYCFFVISRNFNVLNLFYKIQQLLEIYSLQKLSPFKWLKILFIITWLSNDYEEYKIKLSDLVTALLILL